MTVDQPGEFFDLVTASKRYPVSKNTLRRRIAAGDLPVYRVTGTRSIRVRREDVEALFQPIEVLTASAEGAE